MERDSVVVPDDPREAFERITAAFPWTTVAASSGGVTIAVSGGDTLHLVAGDILDFDPERGFSKRATPDWVLEAAERAAREQRYRDRLEAERAARIDALNRAGYGAVVTALSEYAASDSHRWCAAEGEGLRCCIDPDHEKFAELLQAFMDALVGAEIVSVEGLAPLPDDSVVACRKDIDVKIYQKFGNDWWYSAGDETPYRDEQIPLPASILHRGYTKPRA